MADTNDGSIDKQTGAKEPPKGRASLFRIEALQARNELRVVGDIAPKDSNLLSIIVSAASVLGLVIFAACLIYPFPVYVDASGVVERTPADVILASPVAGTVARLYVQDGQEVGKSAAMACIRPRVQQAGPASLPDACADFGGDAVAILAPSDGKISLGSVREADQVEADEPILSIQQPRARLVGIALIDPQKASDIRPDAHATMWPASTPLSRSTGIEAKVTGRSIDLGEDGQPASQYKVRLETAPGQELSLLPGMPFRARILVGSRPLYRYILPGRAGA